MSSPRFTHVFIDEEVRQITERGYVDFARLFQMHQAGAFCDPSQKQHKRQVCLLGHGCWVLKPDAA